MSDRWVPDDEPVDMSLHEMYVAWLDLPVDLGVQLLDLEREMIANGLAVIDRRLAELRPLLAAEAQAAIDAGDPLRAVRIAARLANDDTDRLLAAIDEGDFEIVITDGETHVYVDSVRIMRITKGP